MTKRVISWLLACCLLVTSLAAPASASEISGFSFVDVLDYTDTMVYYSDSAGQLNASIPLPYEMRPFFVDAVFWSTSGLFEAYFVNGDYRTTLTKVSLGNNYYRVYGSVTTSVATDAHIRLWYTTTGVKSLQFVSFRLSETAYLRYLSPSWFYLGAEEGLQASGDSMVMLSIDLGDSLHGPYLDWTSSVRNSYWQGYDAMSFVISYRTSEINNIAVQIGGVPVPFEVNYIENPASFDAYIDDTGLGGTEVIYSVNVMVDLSGVDRTRTDELIITVQGTGLYCDGVLHTGVGYVASSTPDADTSLLLQIRNKIDDHLGTLRNYVLGIRNRFDTLLEHIVGDTDASQEFQDDVSEKTDELGDIGAAMDSVSTPDDFDPNISGMDNVGQFVSGSGIGYVVNSPYILPLFLASMGLCFASYALYGKKG